MLRTLLALGLAFALPAALRAAEVPSLIGADGRTYRPTAEDAGQKATVLVFLMHDCPVTNVSAPELARLAAEFTPKGVRFFGVYSTESAKEIEQHTRDYGLRFPGLLDPGLALARFTGATRAPQAAVLAPNGTLLYRGRIDDRAQKPGVTRAVASRRDLHLALTTVIAGKRPDPQFTNAIGCYLPTDAD